MNELSVLKLFQLIMVIYYFRSMPTKCFNLEFDEVRVGYLKLGHTTLAITGVRITLLIDPRIYM